MESFPGRAPEFDQRKSLGEFVAFYIGPGSAAVAYYDGHCDHA